MNAREAGVMKQIFTILILLALAAVFLSCANRSLPADSGGSINTDVQKTSAAQADAPSPSAAITPTPVNTSRVIHVLVALCDNVNQGIVPVPPRLGNGEDL